MPCFLNLFLPNVLFLSFTFFALISDATKNTLQMQLLTRCVLVLGCSSLLSCLNYFLIYNCFPFHNLRSKNAFVDAAVVSFGNMCEMGIGLMLWNLLLLIHDRSMRQMLVCLCYYVDFLD